jgi:hypothetical protein
MRDIAKPVTLVMPIEIEVQAQNNRLSCLNVRYLENNLSYCYVCKNLFFKVDFILHSVL